MGSVIFVFPGPPEQRQTVKVTAMQTLSSLLPAACAKFKPALDPATAKLTLNKKPVDTTSPFRLINIPNGSIITLSATLAQTPTAAPTTEAVPAPVASPSPTDAAPANSNAPTASLISQPQVQPPQPPQPPVPGVVETLAQVPTPQPPTKQPPAQPPIIAPEVDMEVPQPTQPPTTEPTALQQPAVPQQDTEENAMDLLQLSTALGWVPAREALLTTEVALRDHALQLQQLQQGRGAGAQGAMDVEGGLDDDDSFYELTPEDLADMLRATEARRKEEAAGLKTRALREAEELAKMQALGPVALRLRFHDGLVLQAAFKATDKLSLVLEVVRTMLANPRTPITLFTTPPKQVLKDLDVTLYKAGLVPAALVHLQLPDSTGSSLDKLRPELSPCLHTTIPLSQTLLPGQHTHTQDGSSNTIAGGSGLSSGSKGNVLGSGTGGASSSGAAGSKTSAGRVLGGAGAQGQQEGGQGAKVPKWLKLK